MGVLIKSDSTHYTFSHIPLNTNHIFPHTPILPSSLFSIYKLDCIILFFPYAHIKEIVPSPHTTNDFHYIFRNGCIIGILIFMSVNTKCRKSFLCMRNQYRRPIIVSVITTFIGSPLEYFRFFKLHFSDFPNINSLYNTLSLKSRNFLLEYGHFLLFLLLLSKQSEAGQNTKHDLSYPISQKTSAKRRNHERSEIISKTRHSG